MPRLENLPDFADSKYPQLVQWGETLPELYRQKTVASTNAAQWGKWLGLINAMPAPANCTFDASGDRITISDAHTPILNAQQSKIREALLMLCPWRVGPWNFLGVAIESEWNSFLKWDRIKNQAWFDGARVLDVGCNNGYFGWKALNCGARHVLGCDPVLQYNIQHELFRRYAPHKDRHHILPIGDHELPYGLEAFDLVMSLGTLYHRKSPIDHLMMLHSSLRKGGQLLLETLVIDSARAEIMSPSGRYMKMRGIWFIPTTAMLIQWLKRVGFEGIEIIDVSTTNDQEQRRTEFMPFESLNDFISPDDATKTIEGDPMAVRAVLKAFHR